MTHDREPYHKLSQATDEVVGQTKGFLVDLGASVMQKILGYIDQGLSLLSQGISSISPFRPQTLTIPSHESQPTYSRSRPAEPLLMTAIPDSSERKQFIDKVKDIGTKLHIDPNHLLSIMNAETGGTFSPTIPNAAGSGAVGLIQFMPSTAIDLGTSTAQLKKMTRIQQLDYVRLYFRNRIKAYGPLDTLSKVYCAVFYPAAIPKLAKASTRRTIIFSHPSKGYTQNKGMDTNGDRHISVREIEEFVARHAITLSPPIA